MNALTKFIVVALGCQLATASIVERRRWGDGLKGQLVDVIRYDIPSVWDKLKKVPVQTKATLKTTFRDLKLVPNVTGPLNSFNVTLRCTDANKALCKKASKSFENVLTEISSALDIRETINVEVTMRSFCAGQKIKTCQNRNVVGQASAAAYFVGRVSL